ncbi:sensor histidine kinase [Rhodomicrobium vannielii]|uniref:sensor histidine kinase n=1 Tax=Rhodomicrobium vannielii TaxID=1069 RepID=UPI001FEF2BE6|nr:ATP-binding protein [Rhodomicrobium vannielii]
MLKQPARPEDSRSLVARAGVAGALGDGEAGEDAWIEVIQKMDAVYAELVENQVELEAKNAALEEAQALMASVFASMADVLAVCDRGNRIARVNRALEAVTGRHEASLGGEPFASLFVAENAAAVDDMLARAREDGALTDCELSLRDAAGAPSPFVMNCSARFDHKGRFAGVVVVGRPLGELRRAYKSLNAAHRELQEAQQHLIFSEKMAALGRLVAGVAHELNNPISFVFANMHALKKYGLRIRTYLEAMNDSVSGDALAALRKELKIDRILADIEPLLDGTLEGATRASEIVQDLRRFSANQAEAPEDFELLRVVQTAANWVVKIARSRQDVAIHVPEGLSVHAPRGAIHQILVNLIQNALDAMDGDPHPLIEIEATEDGGFVALRVRDHGPGIAPDGMQKLFEPFFTTKPVGKGLGLGLYLSFGLAQDFGGKLAAANHEGGGAVFTLTLPKGARHAA